MELQLPEILANLDVTIEDPADCPPARWGIIGPGGIARQFLADAREGTACDVTAIGSRSRERAEAFAAQHGIAHAYGSYEELVASDAIDAVYVATPHSEHRDHAILALEAGKPVLVEKSFTRNAAEARETRRREDQRVAPALAHLPEPRVDVAVERDDAEVGPGVEEHRGAARARGADAGAGGEAVQFPALVGDEDVVRVEAPRLGDDGEPLRLLHGEVLEAVDGDVAPAPAQLLLDLLHEEPFRPGAVNRRGGEPVARRADRPDQELPLRPRRPQGGHDLPRLREGERAPPRADDDGSLSHPRALPRHILSGPGAEM